MSKEVTITAYCDGDHETKVLAVIERTLSVDDGTPMLVDLCETCDKAVQDIQVLMRQGIAASKVNPPAPPKRKRKSASRPTPKPESEQSPQAQYLTGLSREERERMAQIKECREPDCIDPRTGETYVAPTRSALGQHVKQKHGKLLSDYDWTP